MTFFWLIDRAARRSPFAVRRYSRAVTKLETRIQQFEEERWREMGALLLTFVVYTQPDGQLVVDR
jgi:hypothetical protein